jgi:uncharacterized membrane protein YeaQ/YmgE (transglycosylase-associated protein family)
VLGCDHVDITLLPCEFPGDRLTPESSDCDRRQRRKAMGIESLIVFLIVGAIAGWLAGLIVKGYGFGLIGNIVVGIVGAFIAGWLFPRIGVSLGAGTIAAIIHATIGAVILLFLINLVKRA